MSSKYEVPESIVIVRNDNGAVATLRYKNPRLDKIIYPVYAKEFLYGSNYENFAFLVQANFKLNSNQWQKILEHWELKESILNH